MADDGGGGGGELGDITDESQALELARREIFSLLPDTESLKKVRGMRKDYTRIKGHLDSQIMRILQSKVEESEDWVSLLDQSFRHIQTVETKFSEAKVECEACSARVQQWQTIKQFNRARNNVTSALAELQLLRSLPQELREVEEMMGADDFDEGFDSLLSIHARLVKLEETRARVVSKHMRREVELADGHHLVRSFEKIVTSWANFEDVIEDNMCYAIELAGAETNPTILVRVLRVIERQTRVDRWWRQSADTEAERLEEMRKKGTEAAEIPGGQIGYRPKMLRERALEWMQTGVERRFQSLIAEDLMMEPASGDDPADISQTTIEKMNELRADIVSVFDDVTPCFPPSFCGNQLTVFDFYVRLYHKKFIQVYELLVDKANSGRLPPGISVMLVNWIDEYTETLELVGMPDPPHSSLRPLTAFAAPLLESNEETFCAQIQRLASNILAVDWAKQDCGPGGAGGCLMSRTPQLLFNLLHSCIPTVFSLPKAKYVLRMAWYLGDCLQKFYLELKTKIHGLREPYEEVRPAQALSYTTVCCHPPGVGPPALIRPTACARAVAHALTGTLTPRLPLSLTSSM